MKIFREDTLLHICCQLYVCAYLLKLDDVRVLAHFKNFDLSSLLEDLDLLHVGLFHSLNCRLSSASFVSSEFNHAKLTLSEHLTHVVEIEEVRVA